MVGGFSVTISLLILSLIGNSQQSETTCPAICMCLGDSVDCSHKGYSTLPSDIPNWTTKLNLNNNRIHSLDSGILNNLLNVKDLKLNRNKITHLFKDAFTNQKKLDILELNRNQLEDIEPLSFQYLEKLSILKLRRNRIKHLLDGTFFGLTAISILELDFNLLSTVTKGWLYGLDHLRVLSLSNNVITQIESDVWDFCKELIDLNLSSNQLGSVQKGTFKHLSQLERLNLNNNKIAHIEEGAFLNTPKLKILWLNNNKLSWTVEDVNRAFSGLADLEKFHLASNQIKSISKNAFIELHNIVTLDLSNNNITTLQNNSFSELTNLKELFLNTSTLVCDCNLQWLADWLRRGNFSKIRAMCAYPLWLREKNIRDVVNFTCDDVPKPRLIEEPKMKMALKGENVSLFCKAVSSSPGAMTFLWKRDNIELHDAAIRETASSPDGRHTEHTSELRLYNIAHTDQGKYQCVVANSYGTTYSQKTRISVLIFPKFSKTPGNLTVRAGDTARLECAAQGEPHPQIAWQKDGGNDFPAARERRMHVMPTDDVFFIVNVKTVDMGVYSCTAQNAAGVMIANATLTVLEIPTFVKPMENKEITAGEPIVLECMAGGSPRPTLTWLKDGGPLKATERHFFTAEDQLMVIVGTTLSDAGRYECLMNNSLGTERGYSELSIIPGTTVNEDDMMGIIIITVVCCAVGTSVIWVVIIYQTRKRINNSASTSVTAMTDGTGACASAADTRVYVEISSEQSSCKDSGTGDSAKHSNLSDNFTLLSDSSNHQQQQQQPRMVTVTTTTPAVFINNSHAPLLQSQHSCPRSTNHDRRQDDDMTEVITKNFIRED